MEKQESKSKIKFDELMQKKQLTVYGMLSINEMIEMFGTPKIIIKKAKIEVLAKNTSYKTTCVERVVSCNLFFNEKLVIRDFPISMYKFICSTTIEFIYVRDPSYNPEKMPVITQQEMKHMQKKREND